MRKFLFLLILALALSILTFTTLATPPAPDPAAEKMAPYLLRAFERESQTEFFVILKGKTDLGGAARFSAKAEKGRYVYQTLWQTAQSSQAPLKNWLNKRGVEYRSFYIVNALLIEGDRELAFELAARSDVARLEANPAIHNQLVPASPSTRAPTGLETNISYVHADDVWDLGFTGQGIVVGGQDTGYDWDHPALQNHYRGWDGSSASHDYNWHDSIHSGGGVCGANSPQPCDDHNHGTHTMGTAVGGDGGSNQIGMAPGAKWIGCRNMNQGVGTPATYLECFEFFLAPYPVGGTPAEGKPELAPDVTINSWTCPPSEGCSWDVLQGAMEAQRAAGIMTVVAAGNSGSSCSTIKDPPSFYDAAYTIGALNKGSDTLAFFSSRGPVTTDGSNRRKPDITAPGTGIRSSIRNGGYSSMGGTSMATPHVAGGIALLWSAVPTLTNNITATEAYLNDNAVHISSTACNSSGVPNNLYGYGRLDVLAAVQAALTPTADFTFTIPAHLTRTVTFTNLSTGSTPFTSTWNFGDGSPPESSGTLLLLVQHTYTKGGDYTVTLTASNRYGASVAHQLITLSVSPTAAFTYTPPVYLNRPVTFTNSSTGTLPITSTWNFGHGAAISNAGTLLMAVQHTYTAVGTYTVVLTAANAFGEDVFSNTVLVRAAQVYLPLVLKVSE